MIPKIIHYCWFGGNPLPKLAKKCIKSWKKYCPDYQIICWDESNYDILKAPLYVQQAYEAKKWAFVTDYVRLQVVYEHGGIYLDTDVELIRPLDELLQYSAYFGIEDASAMNVFMEEAEKHAACVATGLGFGATAGNQVLKEMMDDYKNIPFILADGSYDQTSCPRRNTTVLVRYGFSNHDETQLLPGGICILSHEWLCPFDYWSGNGEITENTISIHWFSASWMSDGSKKAREDRVRKRKKAERKEFWMYFPNRILLSVMGEQRYEKLKSKFRRG